MFENNGVMNGVGNGCSPGKWAVAGDQNARARERIAFDECFNNDLAGVGLVIRLDLLCGQVPRAGYRPMEIIGMRCPEGRHRLATLCPCCGKEAVRVHDAANLSERLI